MSTVEQVEPERALAPVLGLLTKIFALKTQLFCSVTRACARSWSKYASQLARGYSERRKHGILLGNTFLTVVTAPWPEAFKVTNVSLGRDYLSWRCSTNNLCFDKKFMAGR